MKFKLINLHYDEKLKTTSLCPFIHEYPIPINYLTIECELGAKYTYVVWEEEVGNSEPRVWLNGPMIEMTHDVKEKYNELKINEKDMCHNIGQVAVHYYRQFIRNLTIDSNDINYEMKYTKKYEMKFKENECNEKHLVSLILPL